MNCLCTRCSTPDTCEEHNHSCCIPGKYTFLYIVFGYNTEVTKIFGCPIKAKAYAAETGGWLVQSVKLGDKTHTDYQRKIARKKLNLPEIK